jgi:hypothetical protein
VHRQFVDDARNAMARIAGVSALMRGEIPSAISGRAIGMASDRDASILSASIRELEDSLADVARRLLWLWREHMPVSKTLSVIGRNGAIETATFEPGQVKSFHVRIMPGSMLPRHPSYRREQVLQFFRVGLLGNPGDPDVQAQARKLLEWGDLDVVFGDDSDGREAARREGQEFQRGRVEAPQPTEDHASHIDEHRQFVNRRDFRFLHPETQQQVLRHLAWHEFFRAGTQQAPWWTLPPASLDAFPPAPNAAPPGGPPGQPGQPGRPGHPGALPAPGESSPYDQPPGAAPGSDAPGPQDGGMSQWAQFMAAHPGVSPVPEPDGGNLPGAAVRLDATQATLGSLPGRPGR